MFPKHSVSDMGVQQASTWWWCLIRPPAQCSYFSFYSVSLEEELVSWPILWLPDSNFLKHYSLLLSHLKDLKYYFPHAKKHTDAFNKVKNNVSVTVYRHILYISYYFFHLGRSFVKWFSFVTEGLILTKNKTNKAGTGAKNKTGI